MTTVINIFGGPGIGKSGIASGVFSKLKQHNYNVEFATEYAKDLVWEERLNILQEDQLYIFAKQHRKVFRLKDQVEYIVTDCPLLMHIPYIPLGSYTHLEPLIVESALTFNNVNIVLERAKGTHVDRGRVHSEEQSELKDQQIRYVLQVYDPTYTIVPVDEHAVDTIFDLLKHTLKK